MVILIAVAAAIVAVIVIFKLMWRVAEPNEALIISGIKRGGGATAVEVHESLGFKIVTGKGTLVLPGVQTVRRLSLDLRQTELTIDCVTHQGIPLGIRGVVIYKVGDDFASIANAARRFLDQQAQMDQRVHNVFTGHLRAIVGNMTVEEMIRDREKLTQLTRESSGPELEKLGLIVDSLQIQEIEDQTGYIKNLGRPHAAAVESQARIAQADADRLATEKEQEAEALKAEARRTSQVKQAGYSAEVDQAAAIARQAGPKSEAQATQEVVVEQTKVAELEAQREEQRLQATVRKPADAKAYETVTLSRAERDSRIAQAEAEREEVQLNAGAQAQRVKLEAGAEAERVKLAAAAEAEHVKLEATARAEATRNIGQAEADATEAKGKAEGEAVRAKGMAEAEAIKARADALAARLPFSWPLRPWASRLRASWRPVAPWLRAWASTSDRPWAPLSTIIWSTSPNGLAAASTMAGHCSASCWPMTASWFSAKASARALMASASAMPLARTASPSARPLASVAAASA